MINNPKASDAMKAEWDKLINERVWSNKTVRERRDVVAEAKKKEETIHLGSLAGVCVEKNSELKDGDPLKKFKGRVVFLGNNVEDQNWEAAMFQDMGSAPATMEASRCADCYGCVPGNALECADADQAKLSGPTTWISLPMEVWPKEWNK